MYQHTLDPQGLAAALGTSREDAFETTLKKHNYEYSRATRPLDPEFETAKRQHWDYRVNKTQTLDVKAAKRFHRHDPEVQYEMICLELRGGGWHGNSGWLNGKAAGISLEQKDEWLIFNRAALLKWICNKMGKLGHPVIHPSPYDEDPIPYRLYRRASDKYEIIVWCPLKDFIDEVEHFTMIK